MKAIIDCNSFYASCEKVFNPKMIGKPIVVLSNNDGCIIALNDEAKQLGVPMGQAYFKAKALCEQHDISVFSSNYALYGDLSRRVMQTIASIYPDIEVYSIDECFLDIDEGLIRDFHAFGKSITDRVMQWTGIPVSIGVAPTKVLSKVANRLSKKDKTRYKGVYVIRSDEEIEDALRRTKVGDVWGVGWNSVKKLSYQGIDTAYKLSLMSEEWAYKNLGGVVGVRLIRELNGSPCCGTAKGLDHKQHIASTRSFGKPVTTLVELKEAVATYASRAAEKLRNQNSAASGLYVFARTYKDDRGRGWGREKTENAQQEGGSSFRKLLYATDSTNELIKQAVEAIEEVFASGLYYKKAGVMLSGLVPKEAIQQHLFEINTDNPKNKIISKALDDINKRMGIDTINFAAIGVKTEWKMRCELRSPCYTTKWGDIAVIGQ
jgi:DNA polymerase V